MLASSQVNEAKYTGNKTGGPFSKTLINKVKNHKKKEIFYFICVCVLSLSNIINYINGGSIDNFSAVNLTLIFLEDKKKRRRRKIIVKNIFLFHYLFFL